MKPKRTVSRLAVLRHSLQYAMKNRDWLRANKAKTRVAVALTRANMLLGRLGYSDAAYETRVAEYNAAAIEAEKAKYHWERAMDGGGRADWKRAQAYFGSAESLSRRLLAALESGSAEPVPIPEHTISANGTEMPFADGVPLVPEILPLVILQGSDFDMGYQYARQVIEIFGSWILERKAGKRFTDKDLACMRRWEEQVRQYAPEILEMCRGWAAGAADAGVPMRYEDALDLWTGHNPPAKLPHNLSEIGLPLELAHPFCSGVAAWGRATADGRLVTASTGDHNPAHAAVVVAFPETGNNFIATPFHVTGDIRSAPRMFMMGHPGMNSKGVAYVEHGGEPRLAEPMDRWGYGIRKGTEIFHVLRFAGSAREALQMELSFPVGDVGTVMGSVGGLWADSGYAFVPERRTEPVAVREAGMLGETDFLYACNGILHPALGDVWWMALDPDNWVWESPGGWRPRRYRNFTRGMMGDPWKILSASASMIQAGNRDRCLYLDRMMRATEGRIDLEYMKRVLRCGGSVPPGDWRKAGAEFARTGRWGEVSAAHSTNTITVAMKPDDGDSGIYCLCHGEAARGLAPFSPGQAVYMVGETNAFWEIRLASGPEGVAAHAREKARECIDAARDALGSVRGDARMAAALLKLIDASRGEFEAGLRAEAEAKAASGNAAVYAWSRAARRFTRAQVRALQASQAVTPPASNMPSPSLP
jgi:hypothetical protein